MHFKKNVFDELLNIVIDIKGKSKDHLKTRMDLKALCNWMELEHTEIGNIKLYKPKVKFSFTMDQK